MPVGAGCSWLARVAGLASPGLVQCCTLKMAESGFGVESLAYSDYPGDYPGLSQN
jgi:hypothetical protein